jgi:hypothetical protein
LFDVALASINLGTAPDLRIALSSRAANSSVSAMWPTTAAAPVRLAAEPGQLLELSSDALTSLFDRDPSRVGPIWRYRWRFGATSPRKLERGKVSREQIFTVPTQSEANRQADEWWVQQKGLRLIQRTQWAVGADPSLAQAEQWAVSIHFEDDTSN